MKYTFSDYANIVAIGNISHLTVSELKQFFATFNDSVIIYTGDFNLNGKYNDDLDKLEQLEFSLNEHNNWLLMVRGNHDNPQYYKVKSQFRKDLADTCDHILLIPDYQIVSVDWFDDISKQRKCHNILCVGGACSLDRILHPVDFKDEQPKKIKYDIQKLKDVDIIISHMAPFSVYPEEMTKNLKHFDSPIIDAYSMYDKNLKTDIYKSRYMLTSLYEFFIGNNIKIDKWIYGHYNKSNNMVFQGTVFASLALKEIHQI